MYCDHFNLKQRPFSLTPDTSFFFSGLPQRQALNTLAIGLARGDGFIKISGEVGTGKTSLARKLIAELGDDAVVAHINNSYLDPAELKLALAHELGVSLSHQLPSYRVLLHIQKRLVQLARAGKKVIFLIDEAQAMPRDTLEALRLLSNLETSKRKLLQIILLGQPELDQLLQRADLRQLSQRIAYQAQLSNLSECDAAAYLERRLAVAGAVRKLFAPAATKLLIARSGGNPRLLNVLGDKALMSAYAAGRNQVQRSDVLQALLDSSTALNHSSLDTEPKTMPLWAKAAALAAVVLMPGGFAWWS